MKKNKIFSLILIIPILIFSLTGCSPVEVIKSIDTISKSFNSISKVLNEGDIYSNYTTLDLEQTFYTSDEDYYTINTKGKYDSIITIREEDDYSNTNVSIKYDDEQSYISVDTPEKNYGNPYFIDLYNESQKIDFSKMNVTGKIDSWGIFYDDTDFDSINYNSNFFNYTLNYLSGVGIDDFIKVDDSWHFIQVFISPSGKCLYYDFEMTCYKIDDEQFYVKGTASVKPNRHNISSNASIEASISIDNALVSNYKFTLDTYDVNPKDPNQDVHTYITVVSKTSDEKRADE